MFVVESEILIVHDKVRSMDSSKANRSNMSSVRLLLHRKSLLIFFVFFNMSSVRLLLRWKICLKKLVKCNILICLVYVSFYMGNPCIFFLSFLIIMSSVRPLLLWKICLKKLVKCNILICLVYVFFYIEILI